MTAAAVPQSQTGQASGEPVIDFASVGWRSSQEFRYVISAEWHSDFPYATAFKRLRASDRGFIR
jgi:hypothetical protein